MDMSDTKTSQKMKSNGWLSIEKNIAESEKAPHYDQYCVHNKTR